MQLFRETALKLLSPEALYSAQNAPNVAWWLDSARTRWGSFSDPQNP